MDSFDVNPVIDVADATVEATVEPTEPVDLALALEPVVEESNVPKYVWRCAINLVLPFVNGMMLGFGEIVAHEVMFRNGWFHTKVYPASRSQHQQLRIAPNSTTRKSVLV